jgi:Protein of unknown function (DUF2799)
MYRAMAVCLLLGGCAAMSESECRTGNWYALGERDALSGSRPRFEQLAEQCRRYAAQPSEQDYTAGWGVGYSEWNNRVSRRGM